NDMETNIFVESRTRKKEMFFFYFSFLPIDSSDVVFQIFFCLLNIYIIFNNFFIGWDTNLKLYI
ncbi:MAG: hypothetical protein BZ137_07305, partial [Methanosphaera sp. rholeuAM130]